MINNDFVRKDMQGRIVIIRRECNLLTFVQTWGNYKGLMANLTPNSYVNANLQDLNDLGSDPTVTV